jgi:hypothetical protein
MSDELDKTKHSQRLHQKDNYIKRQTKIAKAHGIDIKRGQEHRLAKHSAVTCGDSNCVMCGNPRKFFKEPTIKEQSFEQTQKWDKE